MRKRGLRKRLARLLKQHPDVEFCHCYADYFDGPDVDCFLPVYVECDNCMICDRINGGNSLPRKRKELIMFITFIQNAVKEKRRMKNENQVVG